MESEKIKIAVIGCGGICRWAHMPAYKAMKDLVEITAVCDIKPEKAEMIAKEYGVPKTYTDYKEMLAAEKPDAVDLCVPNYLHSVMAVHALERGFHVFSEKPDAVSVEEVLKMQTAAEQSGKTLMVMRNNRYRQTAVFAKKYIADGKMGEIYAARCGWQRRRGIPGKGGWFTTKAQSGGGPLIDLGVHMIDLAIWLMGNPVPAAVSGCTYSKFSDLGDVSDSVHSMFGEQDKNGVFDVEDLAMGFIRFDNGACMQIEFSWASNVEKERNFVELRGTKAGCELSSDSGLRIFSEEYGRTVNIDPLTNDEKGVPQHEGNLRHFVDVIQNGVKPDFVPQQGVNMIKILEAVYQSAETGREVIL